jgi:hypothetical protein
VAIEPDMRREAEQFAEVVTGEVDLAALVANADVMVAWGVYGLAEMLRGFTGPIMQVSHGCGAWTESFWAANQTVTTHCVAVSRSAATAFGHDRVTIIPNGVDPRRCEALRRREWGLLPHEIAIGFVGRISPEKNPHTTSHAVRALGRVIEPSMSAKAMAKICDPPRETSHPTRSSSHRCNRWETHFTPSTASSWPVLLKAFR